MLKKKTDAHFPIFIQQEKQEKLTRKRVHFSDCVCDCSGLLSIMSDECSAV